MRELDLGASSKHATGFHLALKFHWSVVVLSASVGLLAGALYELRRTPCFEASAAVSILSADESWEIADSSLIPRPTSAAPLRKLEAALYSELLLIEALSDASRKTAAPKTIDPAELRDLRRRTRIETLERHHPDAGLIISVRASSSAEAVRLADRLTEELVKSENAKRRSEELAHLEKLRSDLALSRSRAAELEGTLTQGFGESEIDSNDEVSANPPSLRNAKESGPRQLRLELVAENHLAHSLEARIQRASLELEAMPPALETARRADTHGAIALRHPWLTLPLGALCGGLCGMLFIRLVGTRRLYRTLAERFTRVPGIKFSAVLPSGFIGSAEQTSPATLQGQQLEPYRALRLNLRRLPAGRSLTLAFHPAGSGSAVDEVLASLAPVLASAGHSVIAIDADPRHSRLHEAFNAAHHPGLSDYLAGEMRLEETVVRLPHSNLWFIPAGRPSEEFGELLAGKRLPDLLAEMRARFDYVLLLSPSNRDHAEAALLCSHADHTLVVVDAHRDSPKDLRRTCDWLRGFDCETGGVLVAHRLALFDPAFAYPGARPLVRKPSERLQAHLVSGVDETP